MRLPPDISRQSPDYEALSFPLKLYIMLEDADRLRFEVIVSWQDGGKAFRVHNVEKFTSSTLQTYFPQQTKYKSFQRQLNIYGFQRIQTGVNKGSYTHKLFNRGCAQDCDLVRRSKKMKASFLRKCMEAPNTTQSISKEDFSTFEEVAEETFASNEASFLHFDGSGDFNVLHEIIDQFDDAVFSPQNFFNEETTGIGISSEEYYNPENSTPSPNTDKSFYEIEENSIKIFPIKNQSNDEPSSKPGGIQLSGNSFPWKLHMMLEDSSEHKFHHVVSWVDGGSSFKVHDQKRFLAEIMPLYFDQTKYESFRRQLNLYGFTRVTRGKHRGVYSHPHFQKRDPELCRKLVRHLSGHEHKDN